MHVPEKHPDTNEVFYEWEDDAHLKVTKLCIMDKVVILPIENRQPYPKWRPWQAEDGKILRSSTRSSNWSHWLVNENSQLLTWRDSWLAKDASLKKDCWNWRRANDKLGLTKRERSKYNYQFYNMILDKLMPQHNQQYDFSLLEMSR